MEQRPSAKKPAAAKKPVAPASNDTEALGDGDSAVQADEKHTQDALGATEIISPSRDDDADADAASMLLDDEPPRHSPPPVHKPAGKPKPVPPAKTRASADAVAASQPAGTESPAAKTTSGATDDGGATEVYSPPELNPAAGTAVPGSGAGTTAPAAKGATQAPGAASSGPAGSKGPQRSGMLGDYKLIKKLGAGGMGTVYLAQQVSLERTVALKVLSRDLASKPAFVQRFQREARLMARLDHPNILRCHDVGCVAGNHFLAMEFIDGGSVQDRLKKHGKFELGDALHIVIACTRALQHAHELSMIHRDIKPDNLLLTGKGIVKLADLGLAKATDDDLSLTKTGTGAGTPLYMAPEQARDAKNVDHRSDIYAVGCMLYCFLTGQVPFTGETLVEVIDAKTKGKFTPARRLNAAIPPRLDLIIDKMVAANPNHRYQSCTELLADLEGLELASEHLSFCGAQAGAGLGSSGGAAAKATRAPVSKAASTQVAGRSSGATRAPEPTPPAEVSDAWFVRLPLPGGKTVDKKVSRNELVSLIKDGTLTADTKVSRSLTGTYRGAGTHPELSSLIQGMTVKAAADKKTQKYRQLYAQIDEDEQKRRRSKWFKNLTSKFTGFVGFVIWMFLIVGALAGGVYLVWWLIQKYGS